MASSGALIDNEPSDPAIHGDRAGKAIDSVIAGRPKADGHLLANAAAEICRMRDILVGRRRAGDLSARSEQRLAQLNGVLTVVMSVHFPLGQPRWDELADARRVLKELAAGL